MEEMIDAASVLSVVAGGDGSAARQGLEALAGLEPAPRRPDSPDVSESESHDAAYVGDLRTPSVSSSADETLRTGPATRPGSGSLTLLEPSELEIRYAELEKQLALRTEQLKDAMEEAEYYKKRYFAAKGGERKTDLVGFGDGPWWFAATIEHFFE
jgi:hypothetical protein